MHEARGRPQKLGSALAQLQSIVVGLGRSGELEAQSRRLELQEGASGADEGVRQEAVADALHGLGCISLEMARLLRGAHVGSREDPAPRALQGRTKWISEDGSRPAPSTFFPPISGPGLGASSIVIRHSAVDLDQSAFRELAALSAGSRPPAAGTSAPSRGEGAAQEEGAVGSGPADRTPDGGTRVPGPTAQQSTGSGTATEARAPSAAPSAAPSTASAPAPAPTAATWGPPSQSDGASELRQFTRILGLPPGERERELDLLLQRLQADERSIRQRVEEHAALLSSEVPPEIFRLLPEEIRAHVGPNQPRGNEMSAFLESFASAVAEQQQHQEREREPGQAFIGPERPANPFPHLTRDRLN